jgi:hypothetical protein
MDRIAGVRVELMQLMWCSVMWKVESVQKMLDDRTVRCQNNARRAARAALSFRGPHTATRARRAASSKTLGWISLLS